MKSKLSPGGAHASLQQIENDQKRGQRRENFLRNYYDSISRQHSQEESKAGDKEDYMKRTKELADGKE